MWTVLLVATSFRTERGYPVIPGRLYSINSTISFTWVQINYREHSLRIRKLARFFSAVEKVIMITTHQQLTTDQSEDPLCIDSGFPTHVSTRWGPYYSANCAECFCIPVLDLYSITNNFGIGVTRHLLQSWRLCIAYIYTDLQMDESTYLYT